MVGVEEDVGSEGQGNEPFTIDEDLEMSPAIPPLEFRDPNNLIKFAGCEHIRDSICLRHRVSGVFDGRIVYCMIPDSPSTSSRLRYGSTSILDRFQAHALLMET